MNSLARINTGRVRLDLQRLSVHAGGCRTRNQTRKEKESFPQLRTLMPRFPAFVLQTAAAAATAAPAGGVPG